LSDVEPGSHRLSSLDISRQLIGREVMMQINEDVRNVVAHAQLSFVATIDPDGSPSLSPKASVRVYDDAHVAFMDINSAGTIENLHHDSRLAINSVDFLRRRGYRLKGRAEFREMKSSIGFTIGFSNPTDPDILRTVPCWCTWIGCCRCCRRCAERHLPQA